MVLWKHENGEESGPAGNKREDILEATLFLENIEKGVYRE